MCVFYAALGTMCKLMGDVVRRVVHCRLESPLERPEERIRLRDQGHRGARGRANVESSSKPHLTILRGYILAGRPDNLLTPMDFVAWSALVRNR